MWKSVAASIAVVAFANTALAGSAVVTNGKFTNVYVFPNSDAETWEQHMAKTRPVDADQFSRASIDSFTAKFMQPVWPSYFDTLFQYNGIHPPRFFGSAVASKACVDAALKDEKGGVLQWDTIRSLANCHLPGMDPSPQVNLIFSPDIKIAPITPFSTGSAICSNPGHGVNAWHGWGINTPNFAALPTSTSCMADFSTFTRALSHEVIEILSDPAGMGMGDFGQHELGDNCENTNDPFTIVGGFSLSRYWSNFDNGCEPRLDPPRGSDSQTWVLGQGSPLQRFTGDVHVLNLNMPASRVSTDAPVTALVLVIQTGGDNLRGGNNPTDNANATLSFTGGVQETLNINASRSWNDGETHAMLLALPPNPIRVSDITGLTITTRFGGGFSGDNWNVDKVALVVSSTIGGHVTGPVPVTTHDWLDASGNPLVRFTGNLHDHSEPVSIQDAGQQVSAANIIISTGNDDLRGGKNAGDNCAVTVDLASGKTITLPNVNAGRNWRDWEIHTVPIPLPPEGLAGGDIKAINLHTGFGGGLSGDNWNVNRIQLQVTLK